MLALLPVYKLTSNDGWLITADEIRGALAVARKEPADYDPEDTRVTEGVIANLLSSILPEEVLQDERTFNEDEPL
jgi:hypothetical protein